MKKTLLGRLEIPMDFIEKLIREDTDHVLRELERGFLDYLFTLIMDLKHCER